MKSTIISMFLFLALAGLFGCKDNSTTPSNATVNGDWTGKVNLLANLGYYQLDLTLVQVGQNVGGTGKFVFAANSDTTTVPIPALTGTFVNPDLSITVPGSTGFGGYQGKLQSDGRTIVGNFIYQGAQISMNLTKK
jgi:hypothetical protein